MTARLAERLRSRAPLAIAAELGAVERLEAALEALIRSGHERWPDVPVDDEVWIGHLARHLAPGDVARQVEAMHADGVHLALGALAGNARALVELEARFREVAPLALARLRLDGTAKDELLQDLRERLLVARADGAPPKLSQYSGKGPLEGWLRVVIARAALSVLRDRGADARHADGEALLEQAAADDPQLEALRRRCAPALSSAIEEAIAALPDGDRVLLRLHMVDGLTIDDLAAVYGAHRATTARRLARVRHRIFEGARTRAMDRLGVEEGEFASLMGLMLSRLDVTILRLLRSAGGKVAGEDP